MSAVIDKPTIIRQDKESGLYDLYLKVKGEEKLASYCRQEEAWAAVDLIWKWYYS